MSNIIKPTVGRKVWYRPSDAERVGPRAIVVSPGAPVDATIVAVWGDHCVNLVIFDGNGEKHTRMSAYLKQEGVDMPEWQQKQGYAEWMPYQAKAAAREPALDSFADAFKGKAPPVSVGYEVHPLKAGIVPLDNDGTPISTPPAPMV